MSLPWRFSSSDRYVAGTVTKIEAQSPSFKHLNIGRYYHSVLPVVDDEHHDDDGDDQLTEEQLDCIFSAAVTNPYLNEMTLCGIDIVSGGTPRRGRSHRHEYHHRMNNNNHNDNDNYTEGACDISNSPSTRTTSVAMERLMDLLIMGETRNEHDQHQTQENNERSKQQEKRQQRRRVWKRLSFIHSTSAKSGLAASVVVGGRGGLPVPSVRHIRIKQCRFDVQQSVALQKNLVLNNHLETIELVEEDLSRPESVLPIALGLASSTTTIKTLDFSYCTFTVESMQCLASDGLAFNTSLESILLPGCELDDETASILVRSISNHPNLKHLKLFRNHCGRQTAKVLADILRQGTDDDTKTVHRQDGEGNKLVDYGSQSTTARLESLDLSYQQFERSKKLDIQPLAESLATNTSLTKLTLSFNKLNDHDVTQLANGLRYNTTLQELDLRANNIRDDGVVALAENLVAVVVGGGEGNTPTVTNSTTTSTSSSNNLTKLCLFGNPFKERGGSSLLNAIQQNTKMVVLNMEYNLSQYETIQYYTLLNRMGRRIMKQGHNVQPGVWPSVLSRANGTLAKETRGICAPADLLFHFIRDPAVFGSFSDR